MLGTTEMPNRVWKPLLEKGQRPYAIFSDGGKEPDTLAIAMSKLSPAERERVRITAPKEPPDNRAAYDAFVRSYAARFGGTTSGLIDTFDAGPPNDATPTALKDGLEDSGVEGSSGGQPNANGSGASGQPTAYGVAGAYDATMLLSLGLVAAGSERATGRQLAQAIRDRMTSGTTRAALQGSLLGAFNDLAGGGNIDFVGASGDLAFKPYDDSSVGEAEAPIGIYRICVIGGEPVFRLTRELTARGLSTEGGCE